MTSYERVKRAMHYKAVDKVPVRYYYAKVGYYEHGDKLNDLFATLSGDFQPFKRYPIEGPRPEELDDKGNYHSFVKDSWGTTWEYRIFGIAGIPCDFPLKTQEDTERFKAPAPSPCDGESFDKLVQKTKALKDDGFYVIGPGNKGFYEQMIALYGDENVLCDMLMDEKGINNVADELMEYYRANVIRNIKAGCHAVTMGDDYGSEKSLLMSPETWRSFIKPRLARVFEPAVKAGLDIHFHSCGYIYDILPDLREVGVTSIWPQLPAYNMEVLAKRCRELGLAVEIHTDRARTMTYGTPNDVRELVKREFDTFKMMDGGSWFYIEADNGFPYENIEALVQTIAEYR